MEKCTTYLAPLNAKKESTRQDEKWDEALEYYNTKQFDKIMPTILDYVSADLRNKKTDTGYVIPHGSVIVHITQTDEEVQIKCPFINIENAKKIPLMRRLAEMRMHPLHLAKVSLEGDEVFFYFNTPLHLCEPYKMYSVLREICHLADTFDDEFIEKFDATNVQEPKVTPYAESLKVEAHQNYVKIIEEGITNFDHYMSKRQGNNAWYTLNITLKRIEYYATPQGYLRSEIERAVDAIYDGHLSLYDRLLAGKENLLKLKSYTEENFFNDLYKIETFIPHKYSGKKENIRENWEESYDDVQEMINNMNTEEACLTMLSCFYNLYYYNLIDEDINKPISEAMAKASSQSWNDAAPILLEGMEGVMEDNDMMNGFGMDLSKIMGEQMQQSMAMIQQMMQATN